MIKFIVGKEFIEGKIFLQGLSSGIYTVDAQEDFDHFPVAKGMSKMQLPDNFNINQFTQAEYDVANKRYKNSLDSQGNKISINEDMEEPEIEYAYKDPTPEKERNHNKRKLSVRTKINESKIHKHRQFLNAEGDIVLEYLDEDDKLIHQETFEIATEVRARTTKQVKEIIKN